MARSDAQPECLTPQQVAAYDRDGFIVVESRVPAAVIAHCHDEIARFREEARGLTAHSERIDVEDSHTPASPRIRRIKLPHTISPVVAELMRSDWILAPVRDLIGPNLRLHTSKLNMKSAGYGAAVDWHQDWAFYPHTNDDILAVGVFLDDVGPENGPLMVFPGSHRGTVFDHHAGGVFAGKMSLADAGLDPADAKPAMGPAGSISIHHVRVVHGSDLNRSGRDRAVLFYEITSADAFPVVGSMSPFTSLEEYDGRLLCGEGTIAPRVADVPIRIPQPQPAARGSIYEIQKQGSAKGFDNYAG
jgi:ectoine hydroxylase-related dioxygenase (phytanoyl-CoA dioxygenase family)